MARQALHQTWTTHNAASLNRWRGYAAEFQEQDTAIGHRIEEAAAALAQAQQKLDEAKESSVETVDISDAEVGMEKPEAAAAIMEGMNEMVRSFEAIQQRAEALSTEPPVKKHKGEDNSEGAGKLGSGALAPFGQAKKLTQPQYFLAGR